MPENNFNNNIYYPTAQQYPAVGPNAVNINIISPQAFDSQPNATNPNIEGIYPNYSIYGANQNPNLPLYPQNYNNMIYQNPYQQNPINQPQAALSNQANAMAEMNTSALEKKNDTTDIKGNENKTEEKSEAKEEKTVTPLTDDYIKSLENYLDNDNSKVRLIGARELMDRFKEDKDRCDNKSLIPLLNKCLQDTSASVRFLALTTLQLGYCVGDDETISLLKNIQNNNSDKTGEDALLASEVLLKLSAPQKEVKA